MSSPKIAKESFRSHSPLSTTLRKHPLSFSSVSPGVKSYPHPPFCQQLRCHKQTCPPFWHWSPTCHPGQWRAFSSTPSLQKQVISMPSPRARSDPAAAHWILFFRTPPANLPSEVIPGIKGALYTMGGGREGAGEESQQCATVPGTVPYIPALGSLIRLMPFLNSFLKRAFSVCSLWGWTALTSSWLGVWGGSE